MSTTKQPSPPSAGKRPATREEFVALRRRLDQLSHEEKVALAARTRQIAEKAAPRRQDDVPQNDDELHAAILRETGFNIPRVAVCEDHCAPFDPIADGFFHRHSGILILKSREAGGTLNVSILQYMLCKFIARHEGVGFADIAAQSERAFGYVQGFVYEEHQNADGTLSKRVKPEIEGEPLKKRIMWKIGSLLSLIIGTESGVNSPHPQTVHADEVDLMDERVFAESRNMSSGKLLPDGKRIPALDIITSTRKSTHGVMQKLIDEIEETERQGYEPPFKLYAYCVAEISEEVPECRKAPEDQRRSRLIELGRDPSGLCDCNRVMKGEWGPDSPRTLDTVCNGRFFKSRGWMAHEDVKRKFRQNSQAAWEAQMECRRPMADGLYLPGWRRERYTVTGWVPRAELGNIWLGVDWGGSAESAILWVQGPLRVPVHVMGSSGQVLVPQYSYVVFDEYLEAETGASRLADKVVAREVNWRRQVPGFRVTARFPDVAGRQQRDDWREHDPPLRTHWYLPNRDFDPQVKTLQDLVEDGLYWVDSRCSRHMDDIEAWRQRNGKEVHDESSHTAAAARYCISNAQKVSRRARSKTNDTSAVPVVVQRGQRALPGAVVTGGQDSFASERAWRSRMGETFDRGGLYGRH